jgi:colanic acid/amylovoran biosynthesis glycosyltransferase
VLGDAEDLRELPRTRYVLQQGALALPGAVLRTAVAAPLRLLSALGLALRMSRRAERPWPYHLMYLAEACRALWWMRSFGATHLHAHFGTNSAEVAMLAHALGGPAYSFTTHGPDEFDNPQFIGLGEKLRRCAFAVAITSFARSQLYRWVEPAHWPKIHIVHCGLEPAFHEGAPTTPPTARRLVCVGRLQARKGQILLVQAAHLLVRRGIDFELVLAGDGDIRGEIESLVAQLGLAGRVRITGWIGSEQVRNEILAARCLVLPSFAEGLPVVVMEAMALRRPVITTYVAGVPELVRPGENGWLVPAGSVEELADAMQDCLARSSDELQRIGEAARQRVLERHAIDPQAAKLMDLIRRCAQPPASHRA